MVYIFLCVALGIFIIGIKVLGIIPRVKLVMMASQEAILLMKAPALSEEEKETAIQKAAIRMFGSFASILVRVAAVCLISVGFVLLFSKLGIYSTAQVYEASTNVYFLTLTTITMILALIFIR